MFAKSYFGGRYFYGKYFAPVLFLVLIAAKRHAYKVDSGSATLTPIVNKDMVRGAYGDDAEIIELMVALFQMGLFDE